MIASARAVPQAHDSVDVDEEHAVGDGLEHARSLRTLLGLAVELRIFDRSRCPACKLLRQRKIGRPVAPARFRCDERDHTQRALSGRERHAHVALEAQLADELEVKVVDCELGQSFLGDLRQELALTRAQHERRAVNGVGILGIPAA